MYYNNPFPINDIIECFICIVKATGAQVPHRREHMSDIAYIERLYNDALDEIEDLMKSTTEIRYYRNKISDLENDKKSLSDKISELENDKKCLRNRLERLDDERQYQKTRISELEKTVSSQNEQNLILIDKINELINSQDSMMLTSSVIDILKSLFEKIGSDIPEKPSSITNKDYVALLHSKLLEILHAEEQTASTSISP